MIKCKGKGKIIYKSVSGDQADKVIKKWKNNLFSVMNEPLTEEKEGTKTVNWESKEKIESGEPQYTCLLVFSESNNEIIVNLYKTIETEANTDQ